MLTYKILFLLFLTCTGLFANNVTVQNLTTPDSKHLQFELKWENAWHLDSTSAPGNHDAIWLFVKYQEQGQEWKHLKINIDSASHTLQNSGLQMELPADSVGAFFYAADTGFYPLLSSDIKLSISAPVDLQTVNLKIFAIEMAYIPDGAYYLGDSTSNAAFRNGLNLGPLFIQNESPITIGNGLNQLCDTCSYTAAIPQNFPKGTEDFYCMKYEISQEQYVAFLNTLTFEQQNNRVAIDLTTASVGAAAHDFFRNYRNGVIVEKTGNSNWNTPATFACDLNRNNAPNSLDDGQAIPCNFLNENDIKAYLDWAGLRPMTELEYEKICRGPIDFQYKEYSWGNPLVSNANNLEQAGTIEEYCTDTIAPGHGFANHVYAVVSGQYYIEGPIRCGFAANAQSNRLTAGAAYYGVMEMSGNLWEQCVKAFGPGLQFEGKCGDGKLNNNGFANETGWLGDQSNSFLPRGGSWLSLVYNNLNYEFRDLAVSDRFYGDANTENRRNTTGGRGVR